MNQNNHFIYSGVKEKLLKAYTTFKNDTRHNHGFTLRPTTSDPNSPTWGAEWTAKIFCTDEIFDGFQFTMKINLDPKYPEIPPKVRFVAPFPFHPNVDQQYGSLCYGLLYPDWAKYKHITIPALVDNIKTCFLPSPNFEGGYTEEPTKYYNSYGEVAYRQRVQELKSRGY